MRFLVLAMLSGALLSGCGASQCASFRTVKAEDAVRLASADESQPIMIPTGECDQPVLRAPSTEREVDDVRTVGSGL